MKTPVLNVGVVYSGQIIDFSFLVVNLIMLIIFSSLLVQAIQTYFYITDYNFNL